MKIIHFFTTSVLLGVILFSCQPEQKENDHKSLKDAFKDKFLIGTAISQRQLEDPNQKDTRNVILNEFNAIVAENVMKSEEIQPKEGVFEFSAADQFVDFGIQNNMVVTGHTLIWHSQAPKWFFTDSLGNLVSREVMTERMHKHISTVVNRYKGKIKGWDVVNEAILDDGSYRNSKFYQILGKDFIKLAFKFAHEADPEAELYYNDYSMAGKAKRDGVVKMVKELQEEGIRIDGIGMQSHIGLEHPDISEYEASINAFKSLGLKVMITELDLTLLPMPDPTVGAEVSASFEYKEKLNPYSSGLPDSINRLFEQRYLEFFKLFLKHHKDISRVTLWGTNDAQSWRNNWPVFGRTDYPLLFDRNNNRKPVVDRIIELAENK